MKRVLTIAGSDSGGGAGIQADLKTITVLGGYGMSVITALTAQDTVGVHGIHMVPADFIRRQMDAVLSDIGADAAKTGMLGTAEIVRTVAQGVEAHGVRLLVVDPVMVAKSGDSLLSEEAVGALCQELLPLAQVVTPNLPEAARLAAMPVKDLVDMEEAARRIHAMGPRHVVVKGGHLKGEAVDLLFDGESAHLLRGPRLDSRNTHGTGCTFSAALATFLAQGQGMEQAAAKAKEFVTRAIATGLALGKGCGPTNPYSEILRWKEREGVLEEIRLALRRLEAEPLGHLIPEVRSNLGYALPGAQDHLEVAAIPGRITQLGERIVAFKDPAFGASRHIARVILSAMRHDPEMRSAMNIRYSPEIIEACARAGLKLARFDRREEPREIKDREGSTLEWGTDRAISGLGEMPDAVYDEGDVGKEPMVRVLGQGPVEVVKKVIAIGRGGSPWQG
ncbi:MAG: bifunctional hydroxymethylpyrimidine kinase/phosphomethylpyrimidine kinase [Thermodesulfobacteriota bacterium]